MNKQRRCAVLGLGEFGRALARELTRCGTEVLAVDISAKRVDMVRDEVTHAAVADIRDRAVIAIRRNGNTLIAPGGDARIESGDLLTLVGRDADLAKFRSVK